MNTLFDCGIYRTVSAGGGLELLTRNVQPDAGYRTDTYTARHLQVFQFDTMILRAVRTCQYQNIIVVNIFLLIGKGSDDMGKVHMQVEYDNRIYYGFGANTDIIAASVEAYIDCINKF